MEQNGAATTIKAASASNEVKSTTLAVVSGGTVLFVSDCSQVIRMRHQPVRQYAWCGYLS
jgi:hypothetical protein